MVNVFYRLVFFILGLYALPSFAGEVGVGQMTIDLSPQSLYQHAHPVVKGVVLILLACSVATWSVCVFKWVQFNIHFKRLRQAESALSTCVSFQEISEQKLSKKTEVGQLIELIQTEIRLSGSKVDDGLRQRVESRLNDLNKTFVHNMRSPLSLLATIGSVGPFVGLFGTVWGIMNSFIGIAQTRSTDLFAVAPGIAEALFATALGLVAAIPAVVIYNYFLRRLTVYAQRLSSLSLLMVLAVARQASNVTEGSH